MPTEPTAVNCATAGIAVLGVLSAAIPAVATVLLVLVVLGVAAALVVGIRLWRATRFPHQPAPTVRGISPVTEHIRKEVA